MTDERDQNPNDSHEWLAAQFDEAAADDSAGLDRNPGAVVDDDDDLDEPVDVAGPVPPRSAAGGFVWGLRPSTGSDDVDAPGASDTTDTDSPADTATSRDEDGSTDPVSTDPTAPEPASSEPASPEPGVSEPVSPEPGVREPVTPGPEASPPAPDPTAPQPGATPRTPEPDRNPLTPEPQPQPILPEEPVGPAIAPDPQPLSPSPLEVQLSEPTDDASDGPPPVDEVLDAPPPAAEPLDATPDTELLTLQQVLDAPSPRRAAREAAAREAAARENQGREGSASQEPRRGAKPAAADTVDSSGDFSIGGVDTGERLTHDTDHAAAEDSDAEEADQEDAARDDSADAGGSSTGRSGPPSPLFPAQPPTPARSSDSLLGDTGFSVAEPPAPREDADASETPSRTRVSMSATQKVLFLVIALVIVIAVILLVLLLTGSIGGVTATASVPADTWMALGEWPGGAS